MERQQQRKALDDPLYDSMLAASCRQTRVRRRQSRVLRGHCCEHSRSRCCLRLLTFCLETAVVRPVAEDPERPDDCSRRHRGMIGCRCLWSWSGAHTGRKKQAVAVAVAKRGTGSERAVRGIVMQGGRVCKPTRFGCISCRTKPLRGRDRTRIARPQRPVKPSRPRRAPPPENFARCRGAISRPGDSWPTGLLVCLVKTAWVCGKRSIEVPRAAAATEASMCTIDALHYYITVGRLASTGNLGRVYLQAMASLHVTLLTSAKRNARDHT